jgi:hypothetical protein
MISTWYTTISLDIFGTDVLVVVSQDREVLFGDISKIWSKLYSNHNVDKDVKAIKDLIEEDGENEMPPGRTITINNRYQDVIVVFNSISIAKVPEETIVHEMYHATRSICRSRGIDDEETEAYILEYLFNSVLNIIDKYNEKHPS